MPRIEHVVVLMLENRSFDNLLGRLYPKSDAFDGLSGAPCRTACPPDRGFKARERSGRRDAQRSAPPRAPRFTPCFGGRRRGRRGKSC